MKKTNLFNNFIRIWGIVLIVGFVEKKENYFTSIIKNYA